MLDKKGAPVIVDMSEVSWVLAGHLCQPRFVLANLDVIFSRYVHTFICNDMFDKCTLVTRDV